MAMPTLRTGVCPRLRSYSKKIPEGSKLSPLVDLEVLLKQEVKAKAGLSNAWLLLKARPDAHKEALGNDWDTSPTDSKCLGTSLPSLADHQADQAKTSATKHNKEERLYRIAS